MNGVQVRPTRRFDEHLPWDPIPDQPGELEAGAVAALRRHVQEGDVVVVVGGGRGVTATVAATAAGPGGRVVVYEGAANRVEQIADTISLNGVADTVDIRHAIVGTVERLDGPEDGAETVQTLPACDILEMDCEGAETEILASLSVRPRLLIVETHGNRDRVREQLADLGYKIVSEEPAETRLPQETIDDWGLYTVVAKRS